MIVLLGIADGIAQVPDIAKIAGISVGETTLDGLDQKLDSLRSFTNGQRRSDHEWRSKQTGWVLFANGFFDDASDSRVVGSVILSRDTEQTLPTADLPRQQSLFLGKIALGMSRREVERLIRAGLPPPTEHNARRIVWKAAGSEKVGRHRITDWRAELQFKHHRLEGIEVDAEYD